MVQGKPFGSYELLDRISAGGMAEVFRARDERGNLVALKRILPHVAADEEFIAMFEDEAAIASRLEHPHIARTLDFGHVEQAYFIAFEYVHGKDLRSVFNRAIDLGEHPSIEVLLYIFARIGEGLSYAHGRRDDRGDPVSIVHRDVSPQNIILSLSGDVKLIDFGIAKAVGKTSRTRVGTIKGKFGYMSPEQIRGHTIDARSDVFSLGICMWELLTLERLFSGENEFVVLEKIRNLNIVPPSTKNPDVPAELDRIVLKALAKNVDERYRAAKDLYRDLNLFSETQRPMASREEIAHYMRRLFPELSTGPLSARGSEPPRAPGDSAAPRRRQQETEPMSAEKQGGSDLDIFEGLGKKSTPPQRAASAPPPPPPTSVKTPSAAPQAASNANGPNVSTVGKKTLMGVPAPANAPPSGNMPTAPGSAGSASSRPSSGAMPAARPSAPPTRPSAPPATRPSAPPSTSPSAPPSGAMRAALPNIAPPPKPTPAPSTRPAPYAQKEGKGGKLEMDWDDDDEATHLFDKKDEKDSTKERASNAPPLPPSSARVAAAPPASGTPPPPPVSTRVPSAVPAAGSRPPPQGSAPPPPPPMTKPGGFAPPSAALGAPGNQANALAFARTTPSTPPQQHLASAPPPPPPMNAPANAAPYPPPPPPMTYAGPMGSAPPPPVAGGYPHPGSGYPPPPTINPGHGATHGQTHTAPMAMPGTPARSTYPSAPPNRLEATQLVRTSQASKTWLFAAMGAFAIVFLLVASFFLFSGHGSKVTINVADAKGKNVDHVEIFVDGKKQCDTSPCPVEGVSSGDHTVKVLSGSDATERTVTVESRKDVSIDMVVSGAGGKGGTGLRVAGSQQGVKLLVDDRDIGPLPQELHDLTPGDHRIRITGSERYEPLDKTISISKDEMVDLGSVTLKVVKGKATITLGTPGAKVYLVSGSDRRDLPAFPISVDIDTSKSWTLEATKPSFNDYRQPISFADGQAEKVFNVELESKTAAAAATPAPAWHPAAGGGGGGVAKATPKATAADTSSDSTPDTAAKPETPSASTGGGGGGGDATLNINSIPASSVVLDGKPLGNTPKKGVSVAAGTHNLMFVNGEQGLKKAMTVTVGAGETKTVIGKLRE